MNPRSLARSAAEIIRRLLVALLLVAFALVTTLAILAHALDAALLDPTTWSQMLSETRLAERGRLLAADFLVHYALQSGQSASFLQDFPLSTWEGVADVLLPVDWVQDNLLMIVDVSLGWAASDEPGLPRFTLVLTPVLATLRSPRGSLAILPLLQGVQACPPDTVQVTVMRGSLLSCLPPGRDLTHYADIIAKYVADALPEQVSLDTLQGAGLISQQAYQSAERLRAGVQALASASQFGLRLALFLFSLYALFNSPSALRVARMLAWPLYAAGVLSLLLLAAWQLFLDLGMGLAMSGLLSRASLEQQALLADILRFLSGVIVREWLVWIALLFGTAILVQILTFAGRKAAQRWLARREAETAVHVQSRLRKQFR